MRKLVTIAIVALCALLFLYRGNGQTISMRSYVSDGPLDEERIIEEVDQSLSPLVTGIVERDAAVIFGVFGDTVNARYVRDGNIYDTIATADMSCPGIFLLSVIAWSSVQRATTDPN